MMYRLCILVLSIIVLSCKKKDESKPAPSYPAAVYQAPPDTLPNIFNDGSFTYQSIGLLFGRENNEVTVALSTIGNFPSVTLFLRSLTGPGYYTSNYAEIDYGTDPSQKYSTKNGGDMIVELTHFVKDAKTFKASGTFTVTAKNNANVTKKITGSFRLVQH